MYPFVPFSVAALILQANDTHWCDICAGETNDISIPAGNQLFWANSFLVTMLCLNSSKCGVQNRTCSPVCRKRGCPLLLYQMNRALCARYLWRRMLCGAITPCRYLLKFSTLHHFYFLVLFFVCLLLSLSPSLLLPHPSLHLFFSHVAKHVAEQACNTCIVVDSPFSYFISDFPPQACRCHNLLSAHHNLYSLYFPFEYESSMHLCCPF